VKSLGARETRELLRRYNLRPKTSIGQHFVTDPNTIRKVVKIAGVAPGDQVLEIGPGLGALSLALLDAGARLIAVELDRSLEPVLSEVLAGRDARIVIADAMAVDYRRLLRGRPTTLVANLPYQVATPLILDLLVETPAIQSFTVMVQREVGERLAAAPGEDAYGAVSAKIAYLAEARVAARISRRVFYPMPEVESVVVRIDRRERPAVRVARARLFGVIEAGFAQRRKTIRRALRGAGWAAEDVEAALSRASVPGEARAETLGVPEFAALAKALPAR
jgi:16S rRNA (adenine1518-N6/adenine1519-N6)-dimethyltransferase